MAPGRARASPCWANRGGRRGVGDTGRRGAGVTNMQDRGPVGCGRGAREKERERERGWAAVGHRHASPGGTVLGGAVQTGFEPIQNLNESNLISNSFKRIFSFSKNLK
jgi:hypothetical protein